VHGRDELYRRTPAVSEDGGSGPSEAAAASQSASNEREVVEGHGRGVADPTSRMVSTPSTVTSVSAPTSAIWTREAKSAALNRVR
jgi:hypothetical protein